MDSSKFSYQAMQVVSLAQQEARRLRRKFVGTEELLVALSDPDSALHKMLFDFDITTERLRSVITPDAGLSDVSAEYVAFNQERLPFKMDAELAFEQAIDAAGGGRAEVEHILWGLISEGTAAHDLLRLMDVNLKELESQVFELLNFKDANALESEGEKDDKYDEAVHLDPSKQAPPPRPAGSLKDKYKNKPRKDIDVAPPHQEKTFARRPPTVASWFATQAQSAMAKAFDESEAQKSILGTEHILYGLVCDGTESTTRTFEYTKVNAENVRKQIKSIEASKTLEEGQTLHTSAVTLLEQSRNVMSQSGQEMIDCEHLLIAMLHNSDSIAYTILQNLGVDPRVLKEVLLFWMNRLGDTPGSRSVIGRVEYARTKELKSEGPP